MKICTVCGEEKPESEFHWLNKAKNKKASECKKCRRNRDQEEYRKNPEKHKRWRAQQRDRLRTWWKNYKQTLKCTRCPENHVACLTFHHIDPTKKDANMADLIHRGYSRKRVLEEIEKCEVLCFNCHTKLHYDQRNEVEGS